MNIMRSTSPTTLQSLSANVLFTGVRPRQLAGLARRVDEIDVSDGTVLIRGGHLNRHAYLVVSGTLRVEVDGDVVATVGAGSVVGERSALTHEPANATVVADGAVRLLVLDHRALLGASYSMPQLRARLVDLVQRRDEELAAA